MSKSLLPPSAGNWMRHTEAATARLSDITVALRTLWTPDDCPTELLPYLAWALSVDRWDKDWPASRKIAAIQQSYWLHRRKGTRAAVRRVIESMGFSATFAEWFDTGDVPGTFRIEVDVNDVGITPKTLNELNRLIDGSKPVSRHVAQMHISAKTTGSIYIGVAVNDGSIITVYPPGYIPDDSIMFDATVDHDGKYHYSGK